MRTESMSLQEFAEAVREELDRVFSPGYMGVTPMIQPVEKIMGESYLGIRLDLGNEAASPVLNLEPYYQEMTEGVSLQKELSRIKSDLADVMREVPEIPTGRVQNYEEMKDHLIMQVIPVKGNEERLKEMPHRKLEDMAVVYRVMLDSRPDGQMSLLVTNPVLQQYGVSQEQLEADAAAAMKQRNAYSIRPLREVLAGLLGPEGEEPDTGTGDVLYIATNPQSMYGAGVIAHPDFMRDAAEVMKGDFFILPSSIHEVLLFRDDGAADYRDLEAMVKDINATQVEPKDRLTDTVYHYDTAEQVFETAKDYADRQADRGMQEKGSVLKDLSENRKSAHDHPQKQKPLQDRGSMAL
ncbi:MAG: DUF5688 family protein [Bilifractor sp.]|jgi:hypothetical protein